MPAEAPSLVVVDIETAKLHPNPWNPNQQNPAVARALAESIDAFGHIEPILVRPHPTIAAEFEIVNGEHRWRNAVENERPTVPCIVQELTDAEAQKLTVILNEVSGDADVALLGKLLLGLHDLMDADEIPLALPYSRSELDHLLALGAEDWDDFDRRLTENAGEPLHTLQVKFAEADFDEVMNYLAIIEKESEIDRPAAVLEALRSHAAELHGGAKA